jgi:hypothetical protein
MLRHTHANPVENSSNTIKIKNKNLKIALRHAHTNIVEDSNRGRKLAPAPF